MRVLPCPSAAVTITVDAWGEGSAKELPWDSTQAVKDTATARAKVALDEALRKAIDEALSETTCAGTCKRVAGAPMYTYEPAHLTQEPNLGFTKWECSIEGHGTVMVSCVP
jgi:hypothetical protein